MVDYNGLENRRAERHRGFESLSLRLISHNSEVLMAMMAGTSLFLDVGEMPEWSIGPHSKCGERATVPRVRIPVSPRETQNV